MEFLVVIKQNETEANLDVLLFIEDIQVPPGMQFLGMQVYVHEEDAASKLYSQVEQQRAISWRECGRFYSDLFFNLISLENS